MTRLKTIFSHISFERIMLAALLSALFAWLLREAFTDLLFAGKTFAGRAFPIQILILAVLFLAAFGLLLFALGRLLDRLIEQAAVAAAMLALVPLAAYALMGSFSRFVSDDFSSAALAIKLGVWGAATDWYMHWTGRFSANLIDSLTGYLGQRSPGVQTPLAIFFWLAALTMLIRTLLPENSRRAGWLMSLFLGAMALTAVFQVTPDLPQSLYWAQGMHSLVLPLILAAVLAALLLRRWKQPLPPGHTFSWALALSALTFVAGGFGETYVALQTLGLALALFIGLISRSAEFRRKLLAILLACLAASLLAMTIIILSPGNALRQANFPPTPSLPAMLWIAMQAFVAYLGALFSSLPKLWTLIVLGLAALLAGSGFLFGEAQEAEGDLTPGVGRKVLFVSLVTIGLVYACFVPSAYGMSTTPPGRTLIIPTFLLLGGMGAISYLCGKAARGTSRRISDAKPGLMRAAAWGLLLAFALQQFFTTRGILVPLPEYSRFARVSDQVDAMLWKAKAEGLTQLEIPEVHNHYGLSDFGAGTNTWLDDAVNKYYGLRVIVNKNLNKRFK